MVAIFADSNRARMRYIKSVDGWGTTPTSGRTRELRYTGSTVTASKQTVVSDEIRADRMIEDIIETSAKSAGQINVEFSAGSHDDFLESFMYGAWTRPMTFDSVGGTTIAWANSSTLYVQGADVTELFLAGRRVRTQGFVTPANNDYFQIDTITFNAGANRTEIVTTATSAVAEAGSPKSIMYDANDVIVLKNTAIRFGTAGASTIDSNGANAFAAAIAAGQLSTGQIVFVEGAGYEHGTVTFSKQPAAASKLKISDGSASVTFQFGGVVPQTATAVEMGTDAGACAENLAEAINVARVAGSLQACATVAGDVVTIRNLNVTGGSIAVVVDTASSMTIAQFSGGDTTLRGTFTIQSATGDVLTVSPQPNVFANANARAITVKGSMLRNPSDPADIVPQDYVIETGFEDVSQYFIADGQRVGGFNYDLSANAILKGDYTFSGRGMVRQGDSLLGDTTAFTVLPTTSTPVANATVNVGYVHVNGEQLSTAIQSITITGDNSLRDQNAVGYKFPAGIGAGRMEIKGAIKAYFADGTLWDKFINHDTVSVSFDVQDVSGHQYNFTVPSAVFSTDTVNPAGGNQDIMEDMEYMAKRDPATDCQIQIDRFSCVLPVTA